MLFRQSFLYLHTDNITAYPHSLLPVLSTYISKKTKRKTLIRVTAWMQNFPDRSSVLYNKTTNKILYLYANQAQLTSILDKDGTITWL